MLVVLVLVPVMVVAIAVVVVLDRTGVLPRLDGGQSASSGSGSGFLAGIPKGTLFAGGAAMLLWILAWLVFLVIGLSMLAG